MNYEADRSSFRRANAVDFHRGVVARISEDGRELWLGLPIFFTAYDPPGGDEATVRVRGRNRTVVPWEDTFDQWKWRFLQSIHGFWDRKFRLEVVATRRASAREGILSMLRGSMPHVSARFHPYEVTARDHAKMAPLCFRAAATDPQQTSSCHFFGAYSAVTRQLPRGVNASHRYTSMVDSNDMNSRTFATEARGVRVRSSQIAAHHEVGHHLGLMHRCTRRSLGSDAIDSLDNWYPAHRRFSHPTSARDRRTGGDYCDGSNDEKAIKDVMAMGDQLHPWHAGLWLDVIQHAWANGSHYGSYTWEAKIIE